ncbi:MAG: araC [Labilithrix sp.]|nr:araC [Labilithrix sp.]
MGELADIASRHAGPELMTRTALPDVEIFCSPARSAPIPAVYRPCLCFLAQGAKEVTLGGKVYRYEAGEFLVSTVDLPMTGEIVEATPRRPYLCIALGIDAGAVYDVLRDASSSLVDRGTSDGPSIFIGRNELPVTDAVLRLARCLDDPGDRAVLAPGIIREILYRLLQGKFGGVVREVGIVGSRTQRIAKAIEHLKNGFAQSLRIEELAHLAGMSASSFHEHFKKVTTLSPLQYQKQLRLHEARRLLLAEGTSAADVGFRVGYQSPSQFSREYARFFGRPPRADLRDLVASAR